MTLDRNDDNLMLEIFKTLNVQDVRAK